MSKQDKSLIGMAGTHYVAAELCKRGYIALVTSRNTKGADVICSKINTGKTVFIQVKTASGSKPRWPLTKKAEEISSENIFYIFVKLNEGAKNPDFYILPSKTLAKKVKEEHKKWLEDSSHKDNPMRVFEDKDGKFKDKWDLIVDFLKK